MRGYQKATVSEVLTGVDLYRYNDNKFTQCLDDRNTLIIKKSDTELDVASNIYVKKKEAPVYTDREVAIHLWDLLEQIEMYAAIMDPNEYKDETKLKVYRQFFLQCIEMSKTRRMLMDCRDGVYVTQADLLEAQMQNQE